MKTKIIIGSRGSELALWQSEFVKKKLRKRTNPSPLKLKLLKPKGIKYSIPLYLKLAIKGFLLKS